MGPSLPDWNASLRDRALVLLLVIDPPDYDYEHEHE